MRWNGIHPALTKNYEERDAKKAALPRDAEYQQKCKELDEEYERKAKLIRCSERRRGNFPEKKIYHKIPAIHKQDVRAAAEGLAADGLIEVFEDERGNMLWTLTQAGREFAKAIQQSIESLPPLPEEEE